MEAFVKTVLLYEENGMCRTFEAVVLHCEKKGEQYAVELDKTAFFPEGGGQASDTGIIDGIRVSDVQIKDGCVLHYTESPVEEGKTVTGDIDWEVRFRRMQNHTGEHILSGTLHRMYGANNVGFHLGSQDVTVDTDVVLSREQLAAAECEANQAVAKNIPVVAFKPDARQAAEISYRSKKEIDHDLRLVRIEGVDCCACCAPHVPYTGSIGMIKILDAIHYKGGMRIHLLCGLDAVAWMEKLYRDHAAAAAAMSVKQMNVTEAVRKLMTERGSAEALLREEKRNRARDAAAQVKGKGNSACIRLQNADMDVLRETVLLLSEKQNGIYIAWDEKEGNVAFAGASRDHDMRGPAGELRKSFRGRCGGSAGLIQGTCVIDEKTLTEKTVEWASAN